MKWLKLSIFLLIWLPIQFAISYWLGTNVGLAAEFLFLPVGIGICLAGGFYVGSRR